MKPPGKLECLTQEYRCSKLSYRVDRINAEIGTKEGKKVIYQGKKLARKMVQKRLFHKERYNKVDIFSPLTDVHQGTKGLTERSRLMTIRRGLQTKMKRDFNILNDSDDLNSLETHREGYSLTKVIETQVALVL